jgi:hypothetical protein
MHFLTSQAASVLMTSRRLRNMMPPPEKAPPPSELCFEFDDVFEHFERSNGSNSVM